MLTQPHHRNDDPFSCASRSTGKWFNRAPRPMPRNDGCRVAAKAAGDAAQGQHGARQAVLPEKRPDHGAPSLRQLRPGHAEQIGVIRPATHQPPEAGPVIRLPPGVSGVVCRRPGQVQVDGQAQQQPGQTGGYSDPHSAENGQRVLAVVGSSEKAEPPPAHSRFPCRRRPRRTSGGCPAPIPPPDPGPTGVPRACRSDGSWLGFNAETQPVKDNGPGGAETHMF